MAHGRRQGVKCPHFSTRRNHAPKIHDIQFHRMNLFIVTVQSQKVMPSFHKSGLWLLWPRGAAQRKLRGAGDVGVARMRLGLLLMAW